MLTKAPRGTKDILPDEINKWQFLESEFRKICDIFGYKEIRTPTFEHTELFLRGVGETTDIVEKEMYTFNDKSGRSLTLKPEGTAACARALIEHKLYNQSLPLKLYYIIPGFRYERPQAGRLREFHQFGVEVFGSDNAAVDVEVIGLAMMFLKGLGLEDLDLRINTLGCGKCRENYREALKNYFSFKKESLCDTCRTRLDRNPLRILDCKNDDCKQILGESPKILDFLCDECKDHFEKVKRLLYSLKIDFTVDPMIVRGLDYYTKTVFEIISKDLGAQNTICGGGRYDGLVEECGGPHIPAAGFGMGIERLINVLEKRGLLNLPQKGVDIFLVVMDEEGFETAYKLLFELRGKGLSAEIDYMNRSLKGQMKYADKLKAKFAIIVGEEEIKNNFLTVKDLSNGEQLKLNDKDLFEFLFNNIRKGCC